MAWAGGLGGRAGENRQASLDIDFGRARFGREIIWAGGREWARKLFSPARPPKLTSPPTQSQVGIKIGGTTYGHKRCKAWTPGVAKGFIKCNRFLGLFVDGRHRHPILSACLMLISFQPNLYLINITSTFLSLCLPGWMRKAGIQRKKMMNERGLDSTDYKEDDRPDVPDTKLRR